MGTLLSKLEAAGLVSSELRRQMPTRPAPDPRPSLGREKRFYTPRVSEPEVTHDGIEQLFGLLLRDKPELYAVLVRRLEERLAELGIAEEVSKAAG